MSSLDAGSSASRRSADQPLPGRAMTRVERLRESRRAAAQRVDALAAEIHGLQVNAAQLHRALNDREKDLASAMEVLRALEMPGMADDA